jgi:hypothetical protein
MFNIEVIVSPLKERGRITKYLSQFLNGAFATKEGRVRSAGVLGAGYSSSMFF